MLKRISFPLFLIFIFSACGPKAPTEPEFSPEEIKERAEEGFTEMSPEVDETEVVKDLDGVATEVSGAIDMETFAEPDAAERVDYETGKPG